MNIVKLVLDQLSEMGLGKLGALLGLPESKTDSVVGSAVPALLSGLSNLASTGEGAQKLASALGKFDAGSLGNLFAGQAGSMAEQGNSILGSLFGNNMLTGIINSLSKFLGLGSGVTKNLLGYLSPVILGMIAKQFAGKSINAHGLSSFFAEQKNNIADAMPSGLSLRDIPEVSSAASTPRAVQYSPKKEYMHANAPGSSTWTWLLPVAALACLALLAYAFWPRAKPEAQGIAALPNASQTPHVVAKPPIPEVPDIAGLTSDLTSGFSSLTNTLTGIKDAATATAALPKLAEFTSKLGGMKAMIDKLPEAGRTTITDLVKSNLGKLGDQFSRVLMIPGLSDKVRPALEALVGKATSLVGLPASQFALPSIEVTKVGSELTGILGSLTEALSSVKDEATAETAVAKLKEVGGKLEVAKGAIDKLPSTAKASIGSVLKTSLANLKTLVTKVLAIPVVGDKLKPVVEPILKQLSAFAT